MFNKPVLYVHEFSIDEYYFPEKDYVLITTLEDEEIYDKYTNMFYVTNANVSWFPGGFIVPQTIYEQIIAPLLKKACSEVVLYEKGGDN